jgi:hypothetical protein
LLTDSIIDALHDEEILKKLQHLILNDPIVKEQLAGSLFDQCRPQIEKKLCDFQTKYDNLEKKMRRPRAIRAAMERQDIRNIGTRK